ncbi:hypothetical protein [Kaistia sp. 32K]|uniref:hypothetical protein n=1 Tax=Kaistia sp. 32K TaxID=2795690 RepID=UPI0019163DCE|nr:hypothetical protein [Kaistia sp. 32K]
MTKVVEVRVLFWAPISAKASLPNRMRGFCFLGPRIGFGLLALIELRLAYAGSLAGPANWP